MSDYLSTLAARSQSTATTLRPRIASLFEPLPGAAFSSNSDDGGAGNDGAGEASLSEVAQDVSRPTAADRNEAAHPTTRTTPATPDNALDSPHNQIPAEASTRPPLVIPPTIHAQKRQETVPVAQDDRRPPIISRGEETPAQQLKPLAPRAIITQPRVTQPRITRRNDAASHIAPVASSQESAPTIKVTIGRIEVRAVLPPAARVQRTTPSGPKFSLEDYLKQRNGEQR